MGRTSPEDPEEDPEGESPQRHVAEEYLGSISELFSVVTEVTVVAAGSGLTGLNGSLTTAAVVGLKVADTQPGADAAAKSNDSSADLAENLISMVRVVDEVEEIKTGQVDCCTGWITSEDFAGALSNWTEGVNLHPSSIASTNFVAQVAEKSAAAAELLLES